MMKEKKTIKKKSQFNFYDKEKITIKFLLSNNNYNYMINDERKKR